MAHSQPVQKYLRGNHAPNVSREALFKGFNQLRKAITGHFQTENEVLVECPRFEMEGNRLSQILDNPVLKIWEIVLSCYNEQCRLRA